jgi:hypothetical protein
MRPDESAISGDEVGTGQLDDLLTPVRGAIEEVAQDLGDALTKAGEAIRKLRDIDLSELMKRSPLGVLSVAAALGLVAGFCLWARRR